MKENSWYKAIDNNRNMIQIVISVPVENIQATDIGILFLNEKYINLVTQSHTVGYFRLDSEPNPILMVRADNCCSDLKGSSTMQIMFTFYKTDSGGILGVYLVSPSLKQVFIEGVYGLDIEDFVNRVKAGIRSEPLRLVFTEEGSSRISIFDQMTESMKEYYAPEGRYEINISLPDDCISSLENEFKELLEYHYSLPDYQRNYEQSVNHVWQIIPEAESPVLPK